MPYLSKSPSKAHHEKASFLQRNNHSKYLKVHEFIKMTTTNFELEDDGFQDCIDYIGMHLE